MRDRGLLRWDAPLYAAGALVAGIAVWLDHIPLQRQWGRLALPAYLGAMALSIAVAVGARRLPERLVLRLRAGILLAAIVGVALGPLVLEAYWRQTEGFRGHVQSEVLVTEESASALLHGADPYAASFADGPLGAWPKGTADHVPYLPGMFLFGMPRALDGTGWHTDARIAFAVVALAAIGLAVGHSRARPERALTAVLVVVALPTGARYMTGGGDDLAVLALMLLSLVLLDRRRPVPAGLVAGLAAVVKQTALPLLPFLIVAARDRDGRREWGKALTASLAVMVPVVLSFLLWNPRAFIEDAVLFPLGLAQEPTLAASPTLGSVLSEVLPFPKGAIAVGLGLVVLAVAAYLLVVRPPVGARGAAERTALVLLLAVLLATAGRFGYLLYPIGLFAWARLILEPEADSDLEGRRGGLRGAKIPVSREGARVAKGSGL
ncbi:MAG: glycosyltransferase 87 family protein [Actinomycetota bacterium]